MLEHESPANNIISISNNNNSRKSNSNISSFDNNNVAQVTTTTSTLVKFHSNPSLSSNFSSSTTHSYFMKSPPFPSNHYHQRQTTKGALSNGGGGISQSLSQFALNVQSKGDPTNNHGGDETTRPPFVTTVTRGKFLPSKFDLMVEKSLFSLSNRPRVVNVVPSITKHQCSLSEGPISRQSTSPRGVHDYFNMMWDPRVCRGKTSTSSTTTTMPPIKGRIGEPMDGEGKVGDGNASEPTIKYRKKRATHYYSSLTGGGGGNGGEGLLPNRYKITTRVTTKTKLPKLGLTDANSAASASTRHLHHTHVQTEQFLEDLGRDNYGGRFEASDVVIQTDPIRRRSSKPGLSSKTISTKECYAPMKNGVDVATQVLPGELLFTDEEIQPVAESLVGKILHQALFETMEEEELAAIKEQQNRFQEKRKREERLLKELQEEHERIKREKERLRMNLAEGTTTMNGVDVQINSAGGESNNVILDQVLRSSGLSQCGISTSYLIELLPSVLNSLRQEGFLSDTAGDDLFSSFVPMWRSSSKAESDVGEGMNNTTTTTARSSSRTNSSDVDPLDEEQNKLNVTTEDREDDGDGEGPENKNDEDNEDVKDGHNSGTGNDDIDNHEGRGEEDSVEIDDSNNHLAGSPPGANEEEDEEDNNDEQGVSFDVEMNSSEDVAAVTELMNIRNSLEADTSSQLPNGRIPSFERTEGTVFQEEVV